MKPTFGSASRSSLAIRRLLFLAAALGSIVSACSADPFADLEPHRAIEQLDSEGRPYLSPWDVDSAVVDLQERAKNAGLPVEVTGVYDDDTLAIVLAFQYSQGLTPDGVIGPNTWDALEDPKPLPEEVDALTLVEIASVAVESPSDALQMLSDLGLPPPGGSPTAPSAPEEDAPSGDTSGPSAVVYLATQRMSLLDASGQVTHEFLISSGRDGLTPVGSFKVQSKSEIAYSATDYPDISMQWMTRFNGGIGFHGIPVKDGQQLDTPLGKTPVSAGCIRMSDADAKVVYDILPVGADVTVKG